MGRRVRAASSPACPVEICRDLSRFVEICRDLAAPPHRACLVEPCRDLSRFVEIFRDLSRFFEICREIDLAHVEISFLTHSRRLGASGGPGWGGPRRHRAPPSRLARPLRAPRPPARRITASQYVMIYYNIIILYICIAVYSIGRVAARPHHGRRRWGRAARNETAIIIIIL